MRIEPFFVEQWMNAHETTATWNIAETCVHSLTLDELLELSGDADGVLRRLRETWLGYGDIVGSPRLRAAVAALYGERIGPDNVLTANGAIGANFLALYALVEPGTTVVSVQPTYQQLFSVPESLGADVHVVRLREEDGYLPDVDAIRAAADDRTTLIVLNNPNNPTGALIDEPLLQRDRGGGARARRVAVLRRGLPQARARAGDHGAVGGRPLREGREQREHEQELLAGRPAHRLGGRPGRRSCSAASTCATTRRSAPACSTTPSRPWRSSTWTRCSSAAWASCAATSPSSTSGSRGSRTCGTSARAPAPSPWCTTTSTYRRGTSARGSSTSDGAFVMPGAAFGEEHSFRLGYASARDVLEGGLAAVSEYLRSLGV